MYTPSAFAPASPEQCWELMARHSFATLVSTRAGTLVATHLPLLTDRSRGPQGMLLGHLARANDQWQTLMEGDVLAIFQGPHAYVSPSWYATGPAVPTWNYAAVHAYGTVRRIEEESAVRALLDHTVATYERAFAEPWTVDWAQPTIRHLTQAIVAFEIELTRVEGKFKFNQNRVAADRAGVISALESTGRTEDAAVADVMRKLELQPSNSERGTTR